MTYNVRCTSKGNYDIVTRGRYMLVSFLYTGFHFLKGILKIALLGDSHETDLKKEPSKS